MQAARAGGKHPSRFALGPFQPKILRRDWRSPITLVNAASWLVQPASLGTGRYRKWKHPAADLNSGMQRRQTLKNICAMGMRLNFAIWNNKQTFFHLDILLSHSSSSFVFLSEVAMHRCREMFFSSQNLKSKSVFVVNPQIVRMSH